MPIPESTIRISLGAELLDATQRHARRRKTTLADLARQAIAEKIGRPELGTRVRRGRPPKVAPAEPPR